MIFCLLEYYAIKLSIIFYVFLSLYIPVKVQEIVSFVTFVNQSIWMSSIFTGSAFELLMCSLFFKVMVQAISLAPDSHKSIHKMFESYHSLQQPCMYQKRSCHCTKSHVFISLALQTTLWCDYHWEGEKSILLKPTSPSLSTKRMLS